MILKICVGLLLLISMGAPVRAQTILYQPGPPHRGPQWTTGATVGVVAVAALIVVGYFAYRHEHRNESSFLLQRGGWRDFDVKLPRSLSSDAASTRLKGLQCLRRRKNENQSSAPAAAASFAR